MAKRLWLLGLGLAACCLALTLSTRAADETGKDDEGARNADVAGTALGLASYGREHKYPEALLIAAGMLRTIPPTTSGTLKNAAVTTAEGDEGKPEPKHEKPKSESLKAESDRLIKEALKMGEDLKLEKEDMDALKALAKRAEDQGARGAKGGPQFVSMNIKPGWKDYWKIQFDGKRKAAITVSNDKNMPLHVRVADNDNNTVAEDTGRFLKLSWYPSDTKTFTIHVDSPRNNETCIYKVVTN